MSVYVSQRGESQVAFLETARKLSAHTLTYCLKSPKRLTFFITVNVNSFGKKYVGFWQRFYEIYFYYEVDMNEVFLIGKIITEIKFDFMLNSKKKSIAQFYLKTLDKEEIKIAGYDDIADFCYSRLNIDDNLFLYGFLSKDKVEIKKVKLL